MFDQPSGLTLRHPWPKKRSPAIATENGSTAVDGARVDGHVERRHRIGPLGLHSGAAIVVLEREGARRSVDAIFATDACVFVHEDAIVGEGLGAERIFGCAGRGKRGAPIKREAVRPGRAM